MHMRMKLTNPFWGRPDRLQGGASVQQGLSAGFEFVRHGWHRGAADKRYSLGAQSHPRLLQPKLVGDTFHLQPRERTSMPKIEKVSVTLNGVLPVFTDFVNTWSPPKLKNEVAYRDHLLAYIREAVPPETKVEREFRHRGTTMDIWIGWKGFLATDELAFELKLNLKKKTDFDRLVGQLEGLEPAKNKTLLVLVGETDHALLGRIKEKYALQLKPPVGTTATLAIATVAIAESAP